MNSTESPREQLARQIKEHQEKLDNLPNPENLDNTKFDDDIFKDIDIWAW